MRLVGTFYFYFSYYYYYYYILNFVLVAEYILYYLPAFNWTNIVFINYYLSFNHQSVFLFFILLNCLIYLLVKLKS